MFKEIKHFSLPRGLKFTILVDLGKYYYIFICFKFKPYFFLKIHQYYTFYPNIFPPLDGGHEIYNYLSVYQTDASYQICISFR